MLMSSAVKLLHTVSVMINAKTIKHNFKRFLTIKLINNMIIDKCVVDHEFAALFYSIIN